MTPRTARRMLMFGVFFLAVPGLIALGVFLFRDRRYDIISVVIALISCLPCFLHFERGRGAARRGVRELAVLAVLTALSVLGRMVFAPLPGFKPVSAMAVLVGAAYGPEAGFLVGSLSAVLSNLFFGQGPWTPFQMFAWGMVGFLGGVLFRRHTKPGWVRLVIAGVVGGVLFSLAMDVWTVLALDPTFTFSRYLAAVLSSLPFTAVYAGSNVLFLLILARPLCAKLERLTVKYGVFSDG